MADGSFPTLVSKDTAANAQTDALWVSLSDQTTAVTLTGSSLNVNVTGGSVTVALDTSYTDDSAFTFTTSKVSAIGAVVDDVAINSITENNIGHVRMTPKAVLLTTIADPTTTTQRLAISASGNAGVNIAEQTLTAVKVSATAAANTSSNPIYVSVVESGVSATEVHNYATSTGTGNNDYTVTGTTFLLRSVIFGASGGMKATVQTGPLATLVTQAVGFIPHQGGTFQMFFNPAIEVPVTSTGTARVIMTNREGTAQDVYSTIIGNDIP